jgi:ribA/ribD-fused uncharacterized protein
MSPSADWVWVEVDLKDICGHSKPGRGSREVCGRGKGHDGRHLYDTVWDFGQPDGHHVYRRRVRADQPLPTVRFYRATGPFGYLSNLYPCPVTIDEPGYPGGIRFISAEHAYQWGKAQLPEVRNWIMSAPHGRHAALAGHHLSAYDIVPDWKDVKIARMERVVEAKFRQNPELREKLLGTGTAPLEEESNDGFWGRGAFGYGANHLGSILMGVREKLRKEAPV